MRRKVRSAAPNTSGTGFSLRFFSRQTIFPHISGGVWLEGRGHCVQLAVELVPLPYEQLLLLHVMSWLLRTHLELFFSLANEFLPYHRRRIATILFSLIFGLRCPHLEHRVVCRY